MMEKPTCQTCEYWTPMSSGLVGICNRYSPGLEGPPGTEAEKFCGDHPIFGVYLEWFRAKHSSSVVERPTCESCPYLWPQRMEKMSGMFPGCGRQAEDGLCRLTARKWDSRTNDMWCGEHPLFPYFLKAKLGTE